MINCDAFCMTPILCHGFNNACVYVSSDQHASIARRQRQEQGMRADLHEALEVLLMAGRRARVSAAAGGAGPPKGRSSRT